MPSILFLPDKVTVEVEENTKILVAAKKANVKIRFGCGVGRCGMCGVHVKDANEDVFTEMKESEFALLQNMNLPTSGKIRLACQARVLKDAATVDLNFQNLYSPNKGFISSEHKPEDYK